MAGYGRSPSANVTYPRNEGSEHSRTWVQGIIPCPPEACLSISVESPAGAGIVASEMDNAFALV